MKLFLALVGLFICGFVGVLVFNTQEINNIKLKNDQNENAAPTINPNIKVSLLQPDQALKTTLISLTGQVNRIPWDLFEAVPAATGSSLLQGDEIISLADSSVNLQIKNLASINLSSDSIIELSSLVAKRVLVKQRSGKINYLLNENSLPLNIIAGKILLEVERGEISIDYNNNKSEIFLKTGQAKIGYYSLNDTTDIWQLIDQDSFTLNEINGKVITTGKLINGD